MTWACSSRTGGAGRSVPADPPNAAAITPEREPPVEPAEPAASRDAGPDDCALLALPGEPIATVGLSDRIDPSNAPHPSNASEQLLFRQLYETLVRIDCQGRVRPGLAASWRIGDDGRTWFVTLREDARFSDGMGVTAADVRASWARDAANSALRPHVNRLAGSVEATDDRTLAITLRNPRTDAPIALAHPDLAVAKSVAGSPWPLGTRSARIALARDASPVQGGSVTILIREHLPAIRFIAAPGDPRDLLDAGVDLLLSREPAALDYAATLPHFQSLPLTWQRTHVLLAPGRSPSAGTLSEDARRVLADDAVRGEARGAQGPFWWETATTCAVGSPSPASQSSPTPRIVYDGNDGAARDLAERLVGLARGSSPAAAPFLDVLLPDRPRRTYQRAAGLTGEPLARALQLGTDAGYIVAVERQPIDPCRDLQVLIDRARWLDPATIVPLVETRLQAIVRRGRSGLAAEFDGGLVFDAENDLKRR
jgi:hypothetical protein